MNRRSFLQLIPAALAGATFDPERLLWVPGAKTIFLPTPVMPSVRYFLGALGAFGQIERGRLIGVSEYNRVVGRDLPVWMDNLTTGVSVVTFPIVELANNPRRKRATLHISVPVGQAHVVSACFNPAT